MVVVEAWTRKKPSHPRWCTLWATSSRFCRCTQHTGGHPYCEQPALTEKRRHTSHVVAKGRIVCGGTTCAPKFIVIVTEALSTRELALEPGGLACCTESLVVIWLAACTCTAGACTACTDPNVAEDHQTAVMTGCGSTLWMAPEIFNGQAYNKSVDVYPYAMCLVEISTCKLPWDSVPLPQVPIRVCREERPQVQGELTDLKDGAGAQTQNALLRAINTAGLGPVQLYSCATTTARGYILQIDTTGTAGPVRLYNCTK
jgi:serine/threonine protein kinase